MNSFKMEREEIDNILISVEKQLLNQNWDENLLQLEEIGNFRPLSSKYFQVMAKVFFYKKDYSKVLETLSGKDNWWCPTQHSLSAAELFSNSFKALGDDFHASVFKNLSYYLSNVLNQETCFEGSIEVEKEELGNMMDWLVANSRYNDGNYLVFKPIEMWRFVEAAIMLAVSEKGFTVTGFQHAVPDLISEFKPLEPNFGFFYEQLMSASTQFAVLIVHDQSEKKWYEYLAKILTLIGKQVVLISDVVDVELDYFVDIKETLAISLENNEFGDGYEIIHPVELYLDRKYIDSNLPIILEYLRVNRFYGHAILITERSIFDGLALTEKLNMKIQCLSTTKGKLGHNFLSFGYLGEYTSYIDKLYGMNYLTSITNEDLYDYSIVIPARNSAYTLEYTLETCLEQRNIPSERYEIVISDNSSAENMDVYNLIKKINDPRIKYYKTPRDLPLNRSFEFAFGKARGEFIIALGSDDGLLPWCLETLDIMREKYPEDDVFAWQRGFFQWSESVGSGQAGKFIIPKNYKKYDYNDDRYNGIKAFETLLNHPKELLYTVPTCYINSGFRRRYLKKVLDETGRLWDGHTQDMYMSVVNLVINESYIYMEYPLTIAGMSDASLGFKSNAAVVNQEDQSNRNREMVSIFGAGVPVVGSYRFEPCQIDISVLWAEVFKIIENNKLKLKMMPIIDNRNWVEMFESIVEMIDPGSINYYLLVNNLRENAYGLSEEIGREFDDSIVEKSKNKLYKLTEHSDEKYTTGFTGGLTVDARKFDVVHIADAVQLFEKIANL